MVSCSSLLRVSAAASPLGLRGSCRVLRRPPRPSGVPGPQARDRNGMSVYIPDLGSRGRHPRGHVK